MTVPTFDLASGRDGPTYEGISPREAVIAAHAQAVGDWNTWGYESAWGHLVTEGAHTVTCGDFTALKDPTP